MDASSTFELTPTRSARFRVVVMRCPDSGARIQVVDCAHRCQMFDWTGFVARHVLNSGSMDSSRIQECVCFPCNKELVWHLALTAASARTVYSGMEPHVKRVAQILMRNPTHHHTADDVLCLSAFDNRAWSEQLVSACLDELVERKIVQRIVVDGENIFHDVVTRPHEHVFDPVSRCLYDA